MTSYLPTLKQLQYLVSLEEHGHFGKAADACFVTQSTLSAGLRELETLAGRRAGRAHPARGAVHPARQQGGRQGPPDPARGRGALRPRKVVGQAAFGRTADERDPDHRAVPAAPPAARVAPRTAGPEAVPARGGQQRGGGIAAPRPGRLRAARPAVRGRRCRKRNAVRRSAVRRFSQGRSARSARNGVARPDR